MNSIGRTTSFVLAIFMTLGIVCPEESSAWGPCAISLKSSVLPEENSNVSDLSRSADCSMQGHGEAEAPDGQGLTGMIHFPGQFMGSSREFMATCPEFHELLLSSATTSHQKMQALAFVTAHEYEIGWDEVCSYAGVRSAEQCWMMSLLLDAALFDQDPMKMDEEMGPRICCMPSFIATVAEAYQEDKDVLPLTRDAVIHQASDRAVELLGHLALIESDSVRERATEVFPDDVSTSVLEGLVDEVEIALIELDWLVGEETQGGELSGCVGRSMMLQLGVWLIEEGAAVISGISSHGGEVFEHRPKICDRERTEQLTVSFLRKIVNDREQTVSSVQLASWLLGMFQGTSSRVKPAI